MSKVKITYGTKEWQKSEVLSAKEAATVSEIATKILRKYGGIRLYVSEDNPFARWEADGNWVEVELIDIAQRTKE